MDGLRRADVARAPVLPLPQSLECTAANAVSKRQRRDNKEMQPRYWHTELNAMSGVPRAQRRAESQCTCRRVGGHSPRRQAMNPGLAVFHEPFA